MCLKLHVPEYAELDFRERLLRDPATLAYNRGYDLTFAGYHRDTGCIDFPEDDWQSWYDRWVGCEPERFYAYVVRENDGAFLGEVNLYAADEPGAYNMGIVLAAEYRGQGYAEEALHLLLRQAFEALGAQAVHNDFEETRAAALRVHLNAGFRVLERRDGLLRLSLTREDYLCGRQREV